MAQGEGVRGCGTEEGLDVAAQLGAQTADSAFHGLRGGGATPQPQPQPSEAN